MLPVDFKKKDDQTLSIVWDDGTTCDYNLRMLRKKCPCATCNALRTQAREANPLRVLSEKESLPENLALLEAEIVGRYAVQFKWSDGHHEGIYSFDYLRELCEPTIT